MSMATGIWRGALRWLGYLAFVLVVAAASAWTAAAIYFQLQGLWQSVGWAMLGLAVMGVLALRLIGRRYAWGSFAVAALVVGLWYATILPRQDRDWTPDVAHGVTGKAVGSKVTLSDVRDFAWVTDSEAVQKWDTRTYDLAQLSHVDMITSTWGDPAIAHLIVSFGFDTGEHVAFSVEIRKEKGEAFSSIGGFFREFELVLIAADEADIIKLRTNLRNEDVHLFPVKLKPAQMQALFMSYVDFGNALADQPQFYNTVTANCASTVYRLVKVIKPDMPLDRRLLFSGQLPEYIDELGGLQGTSPMPERRIAAEITAKAKAIPPGQDYSSWIRSGS